MASASKFVPRVRVLRSLKHDPFWNLAFEEWMYRNGDHSLGPYLFLWQNVPSRDMTMTHCGTAIPMQVVIGRNQNPWLECNLSRMASDRVLYVRRRSGGGTVYHDLGNINCTFFSDRTSFVKEKSTAFVTRVLAEEHGIPAVVSPRNDVLVNGSKVSGSAYKLGSCAAYHHCTLLVNTDLTRLSGQLKPSAHGIVSQGVASVRSPVTNIASFGPTLSPSAVMDSLAMRFLSSASGGSEVVDIDPESESAFPGVRQYRHELMEWDWRFGQSPRFTQRLSASTPAGELVAFIQSNRGLVDKFELEEAGFGLRRDLTSLQGLPYGSQKMQAELLRISREEADTGNDAEASAICDIALQVPADAP